MQITSASRCGALAGTIGALAAAGATVALAASPTAADTAVRSGAAVRIHPLHGRTFSPTLGDWEGTIDGFPASFQLVRDRRSSAGGGVSQLVAVGPSDCPVSSSRTSEAVLDTSLPEPLRATGAITATGFAGRLSGARTATLSRRYTLVACRTTLTWRMYPATRRAVSDGGWTMRFGTGHSVRARFSVTGGGRLAAAVPLPQSLRLCHGLSGGIDEFIGARGNAFATDAGLQVSLHFAGDRATGTLRDGGPGCVTRSFALTASH